MEPQQSSILPAVQIQNLYLEFVRFKHASPEGVYLSLTPGNPLLWSGVIFVRKGPYAKAVLRLSAKFPPEYPELPPLILFGTDIFHPLLTPLTTYTYTTSTSDAGTISAADEERMPPGGFSLRHAFPHWFERGRSNDIINTSRRHSRFSDPSPVRELSPAPSDFSSRASSPSVDHVGPRRPVRASVVEIFEYIKSAFDDELVLDSIPLAAAGNPSAWHAWHSFRSSLAHHESGIESDELSDSEDHEGVQISSEQKELESGGRTARRPGEWNWEGVWEERVGKGVEGSLAEPVLFGNAGANDDIIRFLNMDEDSLTSVRRNVQQSAVKV